MQINSFSRIVGKGEKQTYGTQYERDKNGTILYYPISDFNEVNTRRKSVGLDEIDWSKKKFIESKNQ